MATTKIIQSLERATCILELFQNQITELSLKEISDSVKLNKSTTFGLVNSLTILGYLMQNGDNQKYSLGPKILMLSSALRMNNIIIRMAHPYLEELANKYQETVHSAIHSGGNSIIYLDKVDSNASILINTQMGIKNYMHCTSVGKCLLAYKSVPERDQMLFFPLHARTYNTRTTRDSLYQDLDQCMQRGYALDDEEIEIGLSCVGFPVFQRPHTPGFAISIAGATPSIANKLLHSDLLKDMKTTSQTLSRLIYHYSDV